MNPYTVKYEILFKNNTLTGHYITLYYVLCMTKYYVLLCKGLKFILPL